MHTNCRILLVCVAAISLSAATANAQDEPSLGDLARQQRQQKQQAKAAPGKDAKPAKVITNEELPAHAATPSTSTSATSSGGPTSPLTPQALQRCPPSNGSRRFCRRKIRLRRFRVRLTS